jgi:hypothetical protein
VIKWRREKQPVSFRIAQKMSGTFISKCVRLAIQDLPAGVDVLLSKSVIAWILIGDWFHGWTSSWKTRVTSETLTEKNDEE